MAEIVKAGGLRQANIKASASAIGLYDRCPASYKKMYVLREEKTEKKNKGAVFGIAIHKLLENFYRLGEFKREYLTKNWEAILKETIGKEDVTLTDVEINKMLKEGYPMLNIFYNKQKDGGLLIDPISIESFLQQYYLCFLLRARVDMVIEKKGNIYIYDFKTNWQAYSKSQVKDDLQGNLCMWLYKKIFKRDAIFCLHFLRLNKRMFIREINEKVLLGTVHKMEQSYKENSFKYDNGDCKYCMYKSKCKRYKKARYYKKTQKKGFIIK